MSIVVLADQKKFTCAPGVTLLDGAKAQGIVLEYSCRSGRCGICKVQAKGHSEIIRYDESVLTAEEVQAGYILTCCRGAIGDMELDTEDLCQFSEVQVKTLPCRIDSLELLNNDVIKVLLRVPPTSGFKYLPGQYVDMIGKDGLRRSYSLANSPRADGKLELQIRQVPQGLMSDYWFGSAVPNDLLRLEGPQGTFALRDEIPGNLVFMATGTGIAPVKAILEQLNEAPEMIRGKAIHVYWGGRHSSDIYWRPEFNSLDVVFTPVLSRPDDEWEGRRGYIQNALVDDCLDLADSVIYACGSDVMIHSSRELLLARGLSPKKFYSDAFVSSN